MQQQRPQGSGSNQSGPPGANLFVYHIPPQYDDSLLYQAFAGFGQIVSTKVFIDKMTGMSKGFGA